MENTLLFVNNDIYLVWQIHFLNLYLVLYLHLKDVEERLERSERQSAQMREDLANYKHDTNTLISLISTARTHGRWDVSDFAEIKVFTLNDSI